MQFQPPRENPPSASSSMPTSANTIDDALALGYAVRLQGKNEARVLSVSTTKSSLNAAIFADVLVRFYTGEPSPFFGVTPIGLCLSGKIAGAETMPRCRRVGNTKASPQHREDERYRRSLALIRNALSAQVGSKMPSSSLSGPATNLAALLALPGNPPLIAQKFAAWSVAADALTP